MPLSIIFHLCRGGPKYPRKSKTIKIHYTTVSPWCYHLLQEQCVEMVTTGGAAGYWNDQQCDELRYTVCQGQKSKYICNRNIQLIFIE